MRNFWKRANRGLILGGVLILGTSVYVGIDYFRFSHGRDDMEQVLRSYTADLAQAAVTPKNQAVYEYQKTDAEKEALYQALGDVVRDYWTDTHDSGKDYYYVKSHVLMNMHDTVYDTDLPGYVTGYTTNISKITFSKNGPGAAAFSMNMDFVIDTYGSCCFPSLITPELASYTPGKTDYEDIDTDMAEDQSEKDDPADFYEGHLRTTGSVTYYGELLYENGAWKISWMNCRWNGNPINTKPQEGGN